MINNATNILFTNDIERYNKNKLLYFLLEYRDKIVYDMFFRSHQLSLKNFLAVNLLIKKVVKSDIKGEEKINHEKISKLIESFSFLPETESWSYITKDKLAVFSYVEKREFLNIKPEELSDNIESYTKFCKNFKIRYSEDYSHIYNTFNLHLQMDKSEAEQYVIKHKSEYDKVREELKYKKIKNFTTEGYIDMFYDFIKSIYYGLMRNHVYVEVFNLEYLNKTTIKPRDIMRIRNSFSPPDTSPLVGKKIDDFIKVLKNHKYNKQEYLNNIVFSNENSDIFPFFVKTENLVINSFWSNYLMTMFSYMFLEKDVFLRIHNDKSIKFEKEECKNEFEKINYKVWIDQVDRKNSSLQIDLIAFKKKKVFVCEVKIWDIKEYFEQSRTHEFS